MHNGIKGGAVAVLTAAALLTAACSSSGQIGGSAAAGASSPGAASGSKVPPTSGGSVPGTSIAPPTSAASGGAAGKTLSTADISKLLLTDKDDPGYTYDASKDDTTTTNTPDVVKTGGAACQTFIDAQDGLTTKYGTTAEVTRELRKDSVGHAIQDSVLAMPSADKAKAMIDDVTAGLKGCQNLSVTISGTTGTMALAPVSQLMKDGQAGYIDNMTLNGKKVLMAADLVHVGTTVSVVVLIGPLTLDKSVLEQMGATLAHLSDIQVGRLKAAQGLG